MDKPNSERAEFVLNSSNLQEAEIKNDPNNITRG